MTGPSYSYPAYSYCAALYCPAHILEAIDGEAPADDVEAKLDYIAGMMGVDRDDERSFDSGYFPKPATADQLRRVRDYPLVEDEDGGETADRCDSCGCVLAD